MYIAGKCTAAVAAVITMLVGVLSACSPTGSSGNGGSSASQVAGPGNCYLDTSYNLSTYEKVIGKYTVRVCFAALPAFDQEAGMIVTPSTHLAPNSSLVIEDCADKGKGDGSIVDGVVLPSISHSYTADTDFQSAFTRDGSSVYTFGIGDGMRDAAGRSSVYDTLRAAYLSPKDKVLAATPCAAHLFLRVRQQ